MMEEKSRRLKSLLAEELKGLKVQRVERPEEPTTPI